MAISASSPIEYAVSSPKRLNLSLSREAYSDIEKLANENNSSLTEVVRLALGLIKVVLEAQRSGGRVLITDETGSATREIILPK
jgi:hypothetical protein